MTDGAAGRDRHHRIGVIEGDGIGREVVPAALSVLHATARIFGFRLEVVPYAWDADRYRRTGSFIDESELEDARQLDALLFGAHGAPGIPDDIAAWDLLFRIRREFDLFANLRPAVSLGLPSFDTPLDIAIVRENLEGEFAGPGGVSGIGTPAEAASQLTVVSRYGTERIARFAFQLARKRRGKVSTVTKSNSIRHALGYWDRVVTEIAGDYPDVELEFVYVDAVAGLLVSDPARFDVLLCTTLHGDILSDLAAALTGGIGLAPSGNLSHDGPNPSVYEPIHGSAPDIAGRGLANPTAAILAGCMMLDDLRETVAADAIRIAVRAALRDSAVRTQDVGGTGTTEAMTERVVLALAGSDAHEEVSSPT